MDYLAKIIPGLSNFSPIVVSIICIVLIVGLSYWLLESTSKRQAEMLDKQSDLFQKTLIQSLESSEARAVKLIETQKEISDVLRRLESDKKLEQFQTGELLENQIQNNKEVLEKLNSLLTEIRSQKAETERKFDLLTNKIDTNLQSYYQNGGKHHETKGTFV